GGGNREVLHDARDVAETDVDVLDVLVADIGEELVGGSEHCGQDSLSSPVVVTRRRPAGLRGPRRRARRAPAIVRRPPRRHHVAAVSYVTCPRVGAQSAGPVGASYHPIFRRGAPGVRATYPGRMRRMTGSWLSGPAAALPK